MNLNLCEGFLSKLASHDASILKSVVASCIDNGELFDDVLAESLLNLQVQHLASCRVCLITAGKHSLASSFQKLLKLPQLVPVVPCSGTFCHDASNEAISECLDNDCQLNMCSVCDAKHELHDALHRTTTQVVGMS